MKGLILSIKQYSRSLRQNAKLTPRMRFLRNPKPQEEGLPGVTGAGDLCAPDNADAADNKLAILYQVATHPSFFMEEDASLSSSDEDEEDEEEQESGADCEADDDSSLDSSMPTIIPPVTEAMREDPSWATYNLYFDNKLQYYFHPSFASRGGHSATGQNSLVSSICIHVIRRCTRTWKCHGCIDVQLTHACMLDADFSPLFFPPPLITQPNKQEGKKEKEQPKREPLKVRFVVKPPKSDGLKVVSIIMKKRKAESLTTNSQAKAPPSRSMKRQRGSFAVTTCDGGRTDAMLVEADQAPVSFFTDIPKEFPSEWSDEMVGMEVLYRDDENADGWTRGEIIGMRTRGLQAMVRVRTPLAGSFKYIALGKKPELLRPLSAALSSSTAASSPATVNFPATPSLAPARQVTKKRGRDHETVPSDIKEEQLVQQIGRKKFRGASSSSGFSNPTIKAEKVREE